MGTQTVVAALEVLKQEGLLEGHGERRRCRIVAADSVKKAGLRIRLLLYEESDAQDEHTLELQRRLAERDTGSRSQGKR